MAIKRKLDVSRFGSREAMGAFIEAMETIFDGNPAYHDFHGDFSVQDLVPVFQKGVEFGRNLGLSEAIVEARTVKGKSLKGQKKTGDPKMC